MMIPVFKPRIASTKMTIGGGNPDRDRVVTPGLRKWFTAFAEFVTHYKIALHCGICRNDVSAQTAWQHWGECAGYRPPVDGAAGQTIIHTPSGPIWLGGKKLEQVELRAAQMEWLRQFADVGPHFQLGIHCLFCTADITGMNDENDEVYSIGCRCRQFIGPNRDHVEESALVVM